jgi:hypothetical protein
MSVKQEYPQLSQDVKTSIVKSIVSSDSNAETQEEIEARAQRYMRAKEALFGSDTMDAQWYRERYPGFPDNFYDVFERYSNGG